MGQRILALELCGERVRAAVADRTLKNFDLVGVFEQERADDEADLGGALNRVIAASGPPDITISSLPGEAVAKRLLTLPFTDRRRLNQVVPFALEEHLPFAIDDATVAFARVGRENGSTLVLAACARRADIRNHLHLMDQAGLSPKTVTLTTHALAGLLGQARNGTSRPHLMLEVTDASTSIVLIDELGTPRAVRTVPQRLDLNARSAHAILATIRQTVLAHGNELHGTDVIVTGPATADPAFRDELSASLDLPVLDLADFDCSPLIRGVKDEATRFAGCLGMLLGEASTSPIELLNFRQGEFAFHGRVGGVAPWRLTATLGSAVVAVAVLHIILSIGVSARQLHALNTEIATATAPALGDTDPATARAALQAKLKEMNTRLHLLGGNLAGGSPLDILLDLSRAIPSSVSILANSVSIDEGEVKVEGSADSFATVDQIKLALERSGYFDDIQVEHAGAGSDPNRVEFRLSAKLKLATGT